jgi:hypothetical protein
MRRPPSRMDRCPLAERFAGLAFNRVRRLPKLNEDGAATCARETRVKGTVFWKAEPRE